MTQLYEWRGNECESEVQAALQHASPLGRARASAAARFVRATLLLVQPYTIAFVNPRHRHTIVSYDVF